MKSNGGPQARYPRKPPMWTVCAIVISVDRKNRDEYLNWFLREFHRRYTKGGGPAAAHRFARREALMHLYRDWSDRIIGWLATLLGFWRLP